MNHSIHTADRATHHKILLLAMVAGIAFASLGISARSSKSMDSASVHVIKAGAPMTLTRAGSSLIR